jgi:hypothetical protein
VFFPVGHDAGIDMRTGLADPIVERAEQVERFGKVAGSLVMQPQQRGHPAQGADTVRLTGQVT